MNVRDALKAAGLPEEYLTQTETVFRQFVAGEYIPKSRFDELNEKNKSLAKEQGVLEEQLRVMETRAKKAEEGLEPLKSQVASTEAEWQKKYAELENSYRQKEEQRAAEEIFNARSSALKSYIGNTAYDVDMVISMLDLSKLEVKDGKVMGVKEAVDTLRKQKEFLFKRDEWEGTGPKSAPNAEETGKENFGELLAKKALASDALTAEANKKYFG